MSGNAAARPGAGLSKSVVITRAELARLRDASRIITEVDIRNEAEGKEKVMAAKMAKSRARKAKMARLGEEAKRKAPKSDVQLLAEAETSALLKMAELQRDEELDSVKLLQTLGARAAAFTIRHQQLKERDERLENEKIYDQRCNTLMEIERLKGLQAVEKEAKIKRAKRYADKEVLMQQIAAREEERLKRQKAVEQEAKEEMQRQEKVAEEEQLRAIRIQHRKKAAQLEVMKTNEMARLLKQQQKEKEQEEEQKIIDYQIMMNEKQADREAQKQADAEAKELRCAELRKMQERSNDKQSALDELRAKRAAEANERKAREAEQRTAEKKRVAIAEMHRAYKSQHQFDLIQKAKELKSQQEEYTRICRANADSKELILVEEKRKASLRLENRNIVLQQIATKNKFRSQSNDWKRKEGAAIKKGYFDERNKLESIRSTMVQDLQTAGVDTRYLAEMKRADMVKLQMR